MLRKYEISRGDFSFAGITSKLKHLTESNVDAFWLSPIYPSPMVDFGYDISDFVSIDPTYGTMADFEALMKVAHDASLKVIMDFVPNHSSDEHEWFQNSLRGIAPYTDYYVWHKGKVLPNGTVTVPNNWVSTVIRNDMHNDVANKREETLIIVARTNVVVKVGELIRTRATSLVTDFKCLLSRSS